MFVNGYIISPATLKEYSVDTNIETKTRKGKNPPLTWDEEKEIAKQRNCNNAGQVAKLFISFIADKKNNNEQNNKIFKKTTGFTIKEINNSFISGDIKNEGAGIYERTYDKFEILEIYADDIVYAIAQIMQKNDTDKTNKSFNNLLAKNGIEYNFKCPLFDGPCLIPYSKILNAGYDINDCTGSLAGGLHNVDFRNNRIYTRNHLLYGYYKNGRLVQKYGCDYDNKDFHIFSLEDIVGFRIEDGKGEYEYADSERQFFFESMDFILEEKNRIEKEKGIEEELAVYIETDASNSRYLEDIAFSVTTNEYSSNDNLLAQNEPEKLKKLNSKINFKEKINEAKIIATRNRIIRILSKYEYNFIGEKAKFDMEKELAEDGTEKVKAEDVIIKFNTSDYVILNNFVKNFYTISNEYLSFYETDKNVYAVPVNKNEFLKIKVSEESKINVDKRFRQLNKNDFDNAVSLNSQNLSDEDIEKAVKYVNAYKESNIIFFNKNKLKKIGEKQQKQYLSNLLKDIKVEISNIIKKEDGKQFLILKLKDGENNIYYAEVEIKTDVERNLNFELQNYSGKAFEKNKISSKEKEELLNKIASVRLDIEEELETELQKAKTVEIDVPAYDNDYSLLSNINNVIPKIFFGKRQKQNQQLIINREQFTPQLQKWAENNNINLMVLDIKYEPVKKERKGNFLLQYRNGEIIKYKIQKNDDGIDVLTVFSKEALNSDETDLIKDVLIEEFPNAEFAAAEHNADGIITAFEKKYNITKTEQEINGLVFDNLGESKIFEENSAQSDLIKNLLSAA